MTTDEKYMKEALKQAKKAYALKEVPVGCVIVYEDQIIARGYNRRNTDQNTTPTPRSMRSARRAKSSATGDWRAARSTSRWSRARCAPEPSSSHASPVR